MELPPLPFDVIVLYPYQGMHIGELDILERDRIHVSEVLDPAGWWVGTNVRTQQTGLFPSNYIRLDTSRGNERVLFCVNYYYDTCNKK